MNSIYGVNLCCVKTPRTLLLTYCVLTGFVILAQDAPLTDEFAWSVASNNTYDERIAALAVAPDLTAIYATGRINGSSGTSVSYADVFNVGTDPAIALNDWSDEYPMTLNGNLDGFLAKFDTSGYLQWMVNFGGNGNDEGTDVCVNEAGNIFITGYFTDVADFGSLNNSFSTQLLETNGASGKNIFTVCYDPSGNLLWALEDGGESDDAGLAIVATNSGVVISGILENDNAELAVDLTGSNSHKGSFVMKYDFTGNPQWFNALTSNQFNYNVDDYVLNKKYDLAYYNSQIYAMGFYKGAGTNMISWNVLDTMTMNPGPPGSLGDTDLWMASMDENGDFNWTKNLEHVDDDAYGFGLTADFNGLYFAGTIKSLSLLPSSYNSFSQIIDGIFPSVFVAKINPTTGADVAVSVFPSSGPVDENYPTSIVSDQNGKIFMSVNYNDFIEFAISLDIIDVLLDGSENAAIVQFDCALNFLSFDKIEGDGDETCDDLEIPHPEMLFAGGGTTATNNNVLSASLNGDLNAWFNYYILVTEQDLSCCNTSPDAGQVFLESAQVCPGEPTSMWTENSVGLLQWMYKYEGGEWLELNGADTSFIYWSTMNDMQLMLMAYIPGCDTVFSDSLNLTVTQFTGFPDTLQLTAIDCYAEIIDYTSTFNSTGCWNFIQDIPPGTFVGPGIYELNIIEEAQGLEFQIELEVLDIVAPTITCPADITVNVDVGSCTATILAAALGTPVTVDCTVASVSNNHPSTTYSLGANSVVWTVTDGSGLTATCTQTVNVVDNIAPTIFCPGSITNTVFPGTCSRSISTSNPTTADNCTVNILTWAMSGATTGTSAATGINNLGTQTFNLGVTTVTYTVRDVANNNATCSFTVTITDNIVPTIFCPAPITVNVGVGTCTATVLPAALGTPVTADNCSVASVTNNHPSTTYSLGANSVVWTVTDGSGLTANCTQTVNVVDNIAPTISCPGSITNTVFPGTCSRSISTSNPTTSDNCTVSILTWAMTGATTGTSAATGINNLGTQTFNLGVTTVTYTVRDVANNNATCSFTVTITDNIVPTIFCPAPITVNVDVGACTATVLPAALGTPDAYDNCSVAVSNNHPSTTYSLGASSVVWTVTDGSGLTATCTQTVTVEDNIAPTIDCPANITINADAGTCNATILSAALGTPVPDDNCSVVSVNHNHPSTTYTLGDNSVEWTVIDGSGLTATCTQTITVVDNIDPIIYTGNIIPLFASEYFCGQIITTADITPTVDDCSPVTITFYDEIGSLLPSGQIMDVAEGDIITIVATDDFGNQSSEDFSIDIVDNTGPSIQSFEVGDTLDVMRNEDCFYVVENLKSLFFIFDNCDPFITYQDLIQAPMPGSMFSDDFTLFLTVYDETGNQGQREIYIRLNDSTPPEVECPPAQHLQVGSDCQVILGDLLPLVELYDCSPVVQFESSVLPGQVLLLGQSVTATIQAMDLYNNLSTCEVDIEAVDLIAPQVTWPIDETITLDNGCEVQLPDFSTSLDVVENCGYAVVQSPTAGTFLQGGSNYITIVVADDYGNEVEHVMTIMVVDNEFPEIDCPEELILPTTNGLCGAIVDFDITSTDNCAIALETWNQGLVPGSFFPTGITHQWLTVSDAFGNETDCQFDIKVLDLEAPEITCGQDIHTCDPLVFYDNPVAQDNCVFGITPDPGNLPSGSVFPLGLTPVSFVASDGAGNLAGCNFNVHVYTVPDPSWESITNVICSSDNPIDIESMYQGEEDHTWNGPVNSEGMLDPSEIIGETMSITLTVFNAGCSADSSQSITVIASPHAEITGETEVCGTGANCQVITMLDQVSWSSDFDVDFDSATASETIITTNEFGPIEIIVSVSEGICTARDTLMVNFFENPSKPSAGEDKEVVGKDLVVLSGEYTGAGNTSWTGINCFALIDDTSSLITQARNLELGENTFALLASNGICPQASDTVVINMIELVIPNGYSPNEDGYNDCFTITGLSPNDKCTFKVFNRAGNEVFSDEAYANNWCGRNNLDEILDEDTYFYDLNINDVPYNGFIVIKR